MFRIELFDRWPGFRIDGGPACYGRITWGEGPYDYETFMTSTYHHTARWYRRHWDAALQRLVEGSDRTSLVVSAADRMYFQRFNLWVVNGTDVVVHEQIGITEPEGGFDFELPWRDLENYASHNEDGESYLEWRTDLGEVQAFLQSGGASATKPHHRVWPKGKR